MGHINAKSLVIVTGNDSVDSVLFGFGIAQGLMLEFIKIHRIIEGERLFKVKTSSDQRCY